MSYKTYTTKALVCGTRNRNTSDGSFLLFTREAGMLFAEARSIRLEKSRQRYALQDFSLVRVSLIKGRYTWKIGSIEASQNYYQSAVDKVARGSVVSIFRLLRRFLRGEEAHQSLFDYVEEALPHLSKDISERNFVETAVKLKILGFLGYVDTQKITSELYDCKPVELLNHHTFQSEKQVGKLYEHAITSSHL